MADENKKRDVSKALENTRARTSDNQINRSRRSLAAKLNNMQDEISDKTEKGYKLQQWGGG